MRHHDLETYECKSVNIGMLLDIFRKVPAKHPIRNELQGCDGDAQKVYYVWMFQPFPHYSFFAEGLQVWSV